MLSEPQSYGLNKILLARLAIALVILFFSNFFAINKLSVVWVASFLLLLFYSLFSFTYKIVVSDEAISSMYLFRDKTVGWDEIVEIRPKNGGLSLIASNTNAEVYVNPQLDRYLDVVNLIQAKRPDLWRMNDMIVFHQSMVSSLVLLMLGSALPLVFGYPMIRDAFDDSRNLMLLLVMLSMSVFMIWKSVSRIYKLSLMGNVLVAQYFFWKQEFDVTEVASVTLETELWDRAGVYYPVRIHLADGNTLNLQNVKEGNLVLENAIKLWLEKYKANFYSNTGLER